MCVIYIFTTTKTLRTPSNLLVVNLAVSDFLIMFTMGPPMVVNCMNETWVFGPLMCQIYGMFGSLFGCSSIWTMTMIAFDRYNVIVKGLSAKPLTTGGKFTIKIFFYSLIYLWYLYQQELYWKSYSSGFSLQFGLCSHSSDGIDMYQKVTWLHVELIIWLKVILSIQIQPETIHI